MIFSTLMWSSHKNIHQKQKDRKKSRIFLAIAGNEVFKQILLNDLPNWNWKIGSQRKEYWELNFYLEKRSKKTNNLKKKKIKTINQKNKLGRWSFVNKDAGRRGQLIIIIMFFFLNINFWGCCWKQKLRFCSGSFLLFKGIDLAKEENKIFFHSSFIVVFSC